MKIYYKFVFNQLNDDFYFLHFNFVIFNFYKLIFLKGNLVKQIW